MAAQAMPVGRARPSASTGAWASWSHRSRPAKAWTSRTHCRADISLPLFLPSSCHVVVKPKSEHLSSIPHARIFAFTPPIYSTPPRLNSRHAKLQFWDLAIVVPLRFVVAYIVASLHHFAPRQFLYTVSLPWLPLHREHASRSICDASSPLMRPCHCGPPFTSPHARGHCKENGPLAHLLWILVFDDQHNQIGLSLLVSIL